MLAINGFGRVGRCVLRALYESGMRQYLTPCFINELADTETIAHLLKYDSVHGRFKGRVEVSESTLIVYYEDYRDEIEVSHECELSRVGVLKQVDIVLECSGEASAIDARKYCDLNPQTKVIFSRPMLQDEVDSTVVYGFNHNQLSLDEKLISTGSCTTNAIVPILHALHRQYGVIEGSTTTIHSVMNDQPVLDAYHHTDLRKTRAASHSMIPVDTQLTKGIERLLPEMTGRLSSQAVRVPILNVSAIDLSVRLNKSISRDSVNEYLSQLCQEHTTSVLAYSDEALASSDYIHRCESAIIDGTQTRISGESFLKIWVWFDNEWGYAHRMLDTAYCLTTLMHKKGLKI
jgi:D-erythrose 4-phosphate dehydrogenase